MEEVKVVTETIPNAQYVRSDQLPPLPRPVHHDPVQAPRVKADKLPATPESADQKPAVQAREPLTKEELAEMLRRLNLTLDIFEIEAKFTVSEDDRQIKVVLFNTRTGEVIRRIPPDEFKANYSALIDGIGMLFNRLF